MTFNYFYVGKNFSKRRYIFGIAQVDQELIGERDLRRVATCSQYALPVPNFIPEINKIIVLKRSTTLQNCDTSNTKALWRAVTPKSKRSTVGPAGSTDSVNHFVVNISYDVNNEHIDLDKMQLCLSQHTQLCPVENTPYCFEPYMVEKLLSSIKTTATGLDGIPYWVFKLCSFELADIVAHLFKCSIVQGVVSRVRIEGGMGGRFPSPLVLSIPPVVCYKTSPGGMLFISPTGCVRKSIPPLVCNKL